MSEVIMGKKISDLPVVDITCELERRGLEREGIKSALIERLTQALQSEGLDPENYILQQQHDDPEELFSTAGSKAQCYDNLGDPDSNIEVDYPRLIEAHEGALDKSNKDIKGSSDGSQIVEEPEELPSVLTMKHDSFIEAESSIQENIEDEVSSDTIVENFDMPTVSCTDDQNIDHDTLHLTIEEEDAFSVDESDISMEAIGGKDENNEGNDELQGDEVIEVGDHQSSSTNMDDTNVNVNSEMEDAEGNTDATLDNSSSLKETKSDTNTTEIENDEGKTCSTIYSSSSSIETKNSPKTDEGKQQWEESNFLVVTGLSSNTRASDIKALFKKQGKLVKVKIIANTRVPGLKCFAHVTMATAEDAAKCVLNLDSYHLHGRSIRVKIAGNTESLITRSRASTFKAADPKSLEIESKISETDDNGKEGNTKETRGKENAIDNSKENDAVKIKDKVDSERGKEKERKKERLLSNKETKKKGQKDSSDSERNYEVQENKDKDCVGTEKPSSGKSSEAGVSNKAMQSNADEDEALALLARNEAAEVRNSVSDVEISKRQNATRGARNSNRKRKLYSGLQPNYLDRSMESSEGKGRRNRPQHKTDRRGSPLNFDKIRVHRERERMRQQERKIREKERLRRESQERRERDFEKRKEAEYQMLQREREDIRVKREEMDRQKEELIRLERQRQLAVQGRIQRENLDWRKFQLRREEQSHHRDSVKRPYIDETERLSPDYLDWKKQVLPEIRGCDSSPPYIDSYVGGHGTKRDVRSDLHLDQRTDRYDRGYGVKVQDYGVMRKAPMRDEPICESRTTIQDRERKKESYRGKNILKGSHDEDRRASRDREVTPRTSRIAPRSSPRQTYGGPEHRAFSPHIVGTPDRYMEPKSESIFGRRDDYFTTRPLLSLYTGPGVSTFPAHSDNSFCPRNQWTSEPSWTVENSRWSFRSNEMPESWISGNGNTLGDRGRSARGHSSSQFSKM